MGKVFTFVFKADKKIFDRKYSFEILYYDDMNSYEKILDWAEKKEYFPLFKEKMDAKYGYCEIEYDPYHEFYGLHSDHVVEHGDYISVVQDWRNFLLQQGIRCGKIIEIIQDNTL